MDTRPLTDPVHPEKDLTPLLKLLRDHEARHADVPALRQELDKVWKAALKAWGGPLCPKDRPQWEDQNYDMQWAALLLRAANRSFKNGKVADGLQRLREALNAVRDVLGREASPRPDSTGDSG